MGSNKLSKQIRLLALRWLLVNNNKYGLFNYDKLLFSISTIVNPNRTLSLTNSRQIQSYPYF